MNIPHRVLNHTIIILITVFMGAMLIFTNRSSTDIAIVGVVMALLNSGVPISIILDKLIQLRDIK